MVGMNRTHLWKKAAFVLIVLALCLVSVAVVADESFPIPSGLITAQSLDQVTEENIAVGGATISNRELRIKFDYNDPDYWTLFWPYNASVTIYLPLVPGSQPETWDISLPKLYNVKAMV